MIKKMLALLGPKSCKSILFLYWVFVFLLIRAVTPFYKNGLDFGVAVGIALLTAIIVAYVHKHRNKELRRTGKISYNGKFRFAMIGVFICVYFINFIDLYSHFPVYETGVAFDFNFLLESVWWLVLLGLLVCWYWFADDIEFQRIYTLHVKSQTVYESAKNQPSSPQKKYKLKKVGKASIKKAKQRVSLTPAQSMQIVFDWYKNCYTFDLGRTIEQIAQSARVSVRQVKDWLNEWERSKQ